MTVREAKTIKIMIVDDHEVVRGGLRMLIENEPGFTVAGEAGNSKEALIKIAQTEPDVILLDLDLKDESGLDLLPQLSSDHPKSQVLILTGLRDSEIHRHCVRLGARGLVLKDLAPDVLIKAIKKVYAGEIWFDRTMMSSVLSDVLNKKNAKESDPERAKIATLTERENQVLALVCEGLRNKQIAERLFISDTTVRHHLTSIFSKLAISDRLELVIYAYRYGLAKPPK
jgi:DNA-binding NarL/FixJ family response regulator